jgi:hypothetical protein
MGAGNPIYLNTHQPNISLTVPSDITTNEGAYVTIECDGETYFFSRMTVDGVVVADPEEFIDSAYKEATIKFDRDAIFNLKNNKYYINQQAISSTATTFTTHDCIITLHYSLSKTGASYEGYLGAISIAFPKGTSKSLYAERLSGLTLNYGSNTHQISLGSKTQDKQIEYSVENNYAVIAKDFVTLNGAYDKIFI